MAARDVKNDQLKAMTHDAHAEWLASMDDDERFLVHCPDGQWHDLIMAAYFKRVLLTSPMTADERLRFLEFLDGHSGHEFYAYSRSGRRDPAGDRCFGENHS